MAKAKKLSMANATAQWFQDNYPGIDMGEVLEKVLLHSTETANWPGYSGGASAPTATIDPWKLEVRQHFDLNVSARALRDPSGTVVRENRDRVVQFEIIGYCDPLLAKEHGHAIRDIPDAGLRLIGQCIAEVAEWGVPLVAASAWLPFPSSYGDSSVRMSGPEYDAFRGVLGHQHASGNTHGDPGDIAIATIMHYARLAAGGTAEPFTAAQYAEISRRLDYLQAQNKANAGGITYVQSQWRSVAELIQATPEAIAGLASTQ
jgi:hypothetical protein